MLTLLFEYYWYKWRPEAKQNVRSPQNQNGDVTMGNNNNVDHVSSNGVNGELQYRRSQVYATVEGGVDNYALNYN